MIVSVVLSLLVASDTSPPPLPFPDDLRPCIAYAGLSEVDYQRRVHDKQKMLVPDEVVLAGAKAQLPCDASPTVVLRGWTTRTRETARQDIVRTQDGQDAHYYAVDLFDEAHPPAPLAKVVNARASANSRPREAGRRGENRVLVEQPDFVCSNIHADDDGISFAQRQSPSDASQRTVKESERPAEVAQRKSLGERLPVVAT